MSDEINLQDTVEETVNDASVITVEIDETLSISGEAADAKAVGDALALKADASSITAIDVNGQSADNQGHILIDGTDIKMSSTDNTTLKAAIESAAEKTGATIPVNAEEGAEMISAAVAGMEEDIEALQAQTGEDILLKSGGTQTIAEAVAGYVKSVNSQTPDENGNVGITSVSRADNLNSTMNQTSLGAFVFRTTGGDASVMSGEASLNVLKGENTHTGYSPASVSMEVNSEDIEAEIDEEEFLDVVETASGTMVFSYTTGWNYDPDDYGITVTGTPVNGDSITVEYAHETRGTITQSDPQAFIATGWNLYKHSAGYAKVKKYSNEYGFAVSGNYTALKYSATLNGEKSDVTVTNGKFSILADGYIWVTGGDATTTQVWATWGDWTAEANGGQFEPYSETQIDLSALMGLRFPYGLLRAKSYQDEINLATGKAYSRVERMSYSAANLAAAKATGRDYEYDENYIYLGRASQVSYDISISNTYAANDHGEEWFSGTDVAVTAQIVYSIDLRNKLERDTLTISPQSLTAAQQAQVQDYLGVTDEIRRASTEILGGAVKYKEYSCKYSVNANSYAYLTAANFGISAISGYTPVGVVRFTTSSAGVTLFGMRPGTSGTILSLKNTSGSAVSNKVAYVGILFVKNELL